MSAKSVFVSGFRSGTTLLINLLGMHSSIAPWYETKALVEPLRWMRILQEPEAEEFESQYITPSRPAGFSRDPVDARMRADYASTAARLDGRRASEKGGHEQYPLGNDCIAYGESEALACQDQWRDALPGNPDYDAVARATGRLIETLGAKHLAEFGGTHWVNKTPEISRFAAQLRDALGDCRIIYIVRNGEAVVASARALGWGSVEQLAFNWRGLLLMTRAAMRNHASDYMELRYEDLLSQPEAMLNRILIFCGLDTSAAAIVAKYRARLGEDSLSPPTTIRQNWLDTKEQERFDAIAGDLQRELGYC